MKYLIGFFLFFALKIASAAEFKVLTYGLQKGCPALIGVNGEIKPGDYDRFASFLRGMQRDRKENCGPSSSQTIYLDSEGGSVTEAIKMGRMIREGEFRTNVDNTCASACVLLLAAGVERNAFSRSNVLIHRPYFADLPSNSSTDQIRSRIADLNRMIKSYLNDMDVSEALFDRMMAILPEKLLRLTKEEMERYRLLGVDQAYDERQTVRAASFYNMTSAEYRDKSSRLERTCATPKGNLSFDPDCYHAGLANISVVEYKKRQAKMGDRCSTLRDYESAAACFKRFIVEGR